MDEPTSRATPARAPLPDAWWALSLRSRRLIAAGVVAGVALFAGAVLGHGDSGPSEAAAFVAALPVDRVETWEELAQCESEGRWDLEAGNGFHGGLQFTLESWQGVGGTGSPSRAPQVEQIMRAEMLHELQGWRAWPRCASLLGLG